nr:retrovirus-related Pol polyprotein from transposon TNT 1-94 [Tanacetum cinerariifolium]
MDPNSSLGKICLGDDVVVISSDKVKGSGDWNSSEYQDTTVSKGKKVVNTLSFYRMETDEISERYIAPCFVNGLEAYDGKVNMEFDENLLSNEYAVKLCLDYEVKNGKKLVKKVLIIALNRELYLVKFIINPEEDDFEPRVILGRSFLSLAHRVIDFELHLFICKMGKRNHNKKRTMKNLNLFHQDIGPSSSARGHLTQEEAEKEALAMRISQKFTLLEVERLMIKPMAYNDKYIKILEKIWKDNVELDGKTMKEEEDAVKRIKGEALKEKDDPDAFIFPIRATRFDVLRRTESDSDDKEEYVIKKNRLEEHTTKKPDHRDANAQDNTKQWKRCCFYKFTTNSYYRMDVAKMLSLGIAERKNRTLIEAARTLLADLLLLIPFWAEAVNTAGYDQNRVLVTKPHNKTPYELLHGRLPSIGFMRPFGCHVTILNTLDPLGKFQWKVDEGFLVGYSVYSSGLAWLFDIDSLTQTMNYLPVTAENQTNTHAGLQDTEKAGEEGTHTYVLFPVLSDGSTDSHINNKDVLVDGKKRDDNIQKSMSPDSHSSSSDMPNLEDYTHSDDADDVGAEADINNLESTISVIFQHPESTKIIQPLKLLVIYLQLLRPKVWPKQLKIKWELSPGSGNALCILFPTVTMADNRTMEKILQAPTEGYGDAIVVPDILAENFKIRTSLLLLIQTNQFHGFESNNLHDHIRSFNRITSTLKFRDVPKDAIKLMIFHICSREPLKFGTKKNHPGSVGKIQGNA